MTDEITAIDITGFPASFWMRTKDMENPDVWIHEFSEAALLDTIAKTSPGCEWNITAVSQGDKEHITTYIHIITALQGPSCLIDRWVTPEEFIFIFLGNRLRRKTTND